MPSKLKSTFERAQTYLRQHRIDGWLLHDFQGNNPILWQLYGSQPHTTRRVDLLIPAQGEVRLLVSAVDAGQFRDFPGRRCSIPGCPAIPLPTRRVAERR